MLCICENNRVIQSYRVSLGRNGLGKMHEGDKKTPIGLYELSAPRKSRKFGIFIPIKYPTQQQIIDGFTGKDVGIHGPFKLFGWATFFNAWFNWTQGCIAVGDNKELVSIAKWVNEHPNTNILIN